MPTCPTPDDAPSPCPDPNLCPLCGAPNVCAQAAGAPQDAPCWCLNMTFTPELLARLPEAERGMSCICEACANAASASVPPA